MGCRQHAVVPGLGNGQRLEAAGLDGFQGTHHQSSGETDVQIPRGRPHQQGFGDLGLIGKAFDQPNHTPAHQHTPAERQRNAAVDQFQRCDQPEPHGQHRKQPQAAVDPITPVRGLAVAHHHLGQQQGDQAVAQVGGPDQAWEGKTHQHQQREQEQQTQVRSLLPSRHGPDPSLLAWCAGRGLRTS